MGDILTIDDRIKASRRASAVVRAWEVAKSLEKDRAQIEGLKWVEPERIEGKGITRAIDFASKFPEDTTYLQPVPMSINVIAPGNLLVPGEDMQVAWTMPILTRMTKTDYELEGTVKSELGLNNWDKPSLRNTVDVVSFLPFPKADAAEEERFKPEFCVTLEINAELGNPKNYYAAVSRYNGKTVKQIVYADAPKYLVILADPNTKTHFSADMLVNMSAEEVANTPANAGTLDIFVYRITQGGFDYSKMAKMIEGYDVGSGFGGGDACLYSLGPDLSRSLGATKGLSFGDTGSSSRFLSSLPDVPRRQQTPAKDVAKEVGDVSIGEGTVQERVEYESLQGYMHDKSFAVQPIRIRFLGVREAAQQAAMEELQKIAVGYRS